MLDRVGTVAFDSQDGLHYLFVNHAGELVYVSPGGSGNAGQMSVVAQGARDFMLALDASDRPHVVYATDAGVFYARP